MIIKFLKSAFILDLCRYQGDAEFFRRWLEVDPFGTLENGIIRESVREIPQTIIPPYKFYINLNIEFFERLVSNLLVVFNISLMLILITMSMYLFLLPVFYVLTCIIVNCIVTVKELKQIKIDMLEIYQELLIQYKM